MNQSHDENDPSSTPATVFMDILAEGAAVPRRVPLSQDRMIIGRAADAGVRLDSQTVSRQHAELYKDPYGRWWVRDLGSRNGTRVNGNKVHEHLLEPTDILQVENFTLQPRGLGSTTRKRRPVDTTGGITLGDNESSDIRKLADMETPQIAADHIGVLSRFADELLAIEDSQQRLEHLCQLMVGQYLQGQSAVVLRISRHAGHTMTDAQNVICGPFSSRNWKRDELPYVSRTLLYAARENAVPVVASNVSNDTGIVAMSLAGSVMKAAAIACPLATHDEAASPIASDDPHTPSDTMDLLYVTFPAEYGSAQWLALCALAAEQHRHAQAAWDARRRAQEQALIETELARARQIQQRLIPTHVAIPKMDIAMGFEPCKWVGGDYIDAIALPDGKALLFVADVCGKGLQAALITACIHAMIHTSITPALDVADLMDRLNIYLGKTLPDCSFVTAIALLIDPDTGRYTFVNAGHPPILLSQQGRRTLPLEAGVNPPLGFMPQPLQPCQGTLEQGQMLTLYTDGLSEMTHHETDAMLNPDGLADMLTHALDHATDSLKNCVANLEKQLEDWQGAMAAQDDKAYILAISRR